MSTSNKPFNAEEWIAGLKAHTKAGTVPPTIDSSSPHDSFNRFKSNASAVADQKAPLTRRLAQNWSKLDGGGKVNVAIWGAAALFSALNAVGVGSNAFRRDHEGKIHTQWSNVGVALLQATLAVGCAYAGTHALRSATR